jgi:CRISPR-associated protein Cmr2
MLLFSLGPVQSFIAQARKTRDLWLGSFLLSVLMQESMKDIHANLIFPHNPRIEKNIPDLPNKYIAIFDTTDEAVKAAERSETSIKAFWGKLCEDVWTNVFAILPHINPGTRQQWERQTDPQTLFEFFWVVVAGSEEHYTHWLKETQWLFDRRKHLRDFRQQPEDGEKSTISGQRAALRGAGEWRTDVQMFWYEVAGQQSPKDISQDGTERLDAIDTVKRFAHLSTSLAQLLGHTTGQSLKVGFPSTSSIATASFLEQLLPVSDNPAIAPALRVWLSKARQLGETMPATIPLLIEQARPYTHGSQILEQDGDCFFPETFSERRLQKEFGFDRKPPAESQRLAKSGPQAIATLLEATDALTPALLHPRSYYAMIQMDGDQMGKLINGVKDRKEHEAISQALSFFSRTEVAGLVQDSYPGRLIYAGGDDVFALAPLTRQIVPGASTDTGLPMTTVLELVDRLQEKYHTTVRKAVENDPAADPAMTARKNLVSASAGIAIAHHYTSLSYVRRISKEAEQLAKHHYGRNALVVSVLRRSGEQTRVGCHWHYHDLANEAQPMRLFSTFYALFAAEILSPACVYTLLSEVPTLVGLSLAAQQSEIKRILLRHIPDRHRRVADTIMPQQAEYLVRLAAAIDQAEHPLRQQPASVELHAPGRRYGLVEVSGWLLVMLFLVRKEQK